MASPSMRITTLALTAALILTGCSDTSPEGRIQTAKEAMRDADYKTATIELKNLLQIAPNNLEARVLLGQALQTQEQWADSEKHLRQAIQLGAPKEQALPWLARTLVKMGKFQDAADLEVPHSGMTAQAMASLQAERANALIYLKNAQEAGTAISEGERALANIGTSEPSEDLQIAKAKLAFINKQSAQAMSLVSDSLRRNPKNLEALYTKAQFLLTENKETEAFNVLQQIIAVKPSEILAHVAIADIQLHAGNLGAAEAAIVNAEKMNSSLPRVKYARAKLELRRGNLTKANETILHILRVAPGHLPSVLLGSAVSYGLGNYEQSQKGAALVLAQLPGEAFATKLLAASQLKQGNHKVALETVISGLRLSPDDAELLSMAGEAHLQAKNYTKAMDYLDRAATLQPRNQEIKQKLAQGYMAVGEMERGLAELQQAVDLSEKASRADTFLINILLARKEFDKALQAVAVLDKKLPNNPVSHTLRAAVYQGKNDRTAARRELEKALAIQPEFFPAIAKLALMDVEDKRPEQARKRFEALLEKSADNINAMMALAKLAQAAKQDGEYRKWLERAAQAQPHAIPPRASLAQHYLSRNEPTRAVAIAREAVTANPGSAEALTMLGGVQLAIGEQQNALVSLAQATIKEPGSADTHYQLGSAQMTVKRLGDARVSLEKALSIQSGHPGALIKLHQLLVLVGDKAAAEYRFNQIQKHHADNPAVQVYVAQQYQSSGRNREAVALYEAVLPKLPGNAAVMNNLANLYYLEKDGRALQMAEQAYRLVPENADVIDTLGWILVEQGQAKRAIDLLHRALEKAPKSASIRYHYAVALSRGGNNAAARKELEQLIKSGQKFPQLVDAKKLLAGIL